MKRAMLLLLVLTMTGCLDLPIRPEPDAKFGKTTKTSEAQTATPKPALVQETSAVAPDQVSDGNAPQVLDALRDEIDHAANERASEPKP